MASRIWIGSLQTKLKKCPTCGQRWPHGKVDAAKPPSDLFGARSTTVHPSLRPLLTAAHLSAKEQAKFLSVNVETGVDGIWLIVPDEEVGQDLRDSFDTALQMAAQQVWRHKSPVMRVIKWAVQS